MTAEAPPEAPQRPEKALRGLPVQPEAAVLEAHRRRVEAAKAEERAQALAQRREDAQRRAAERMAGLRRSALAVAAKVDPHAEARAEMTSAAAEHSRLSGEGERLHGRLRAAVQAADADAIVSIRRELDELPARRFAAEVRWLRLAADLYEAEDRRLQEQLADPALTARLEAAQEALQAAQVEHATASAAVGGVRGAQLDARSSAGEMRRRLGDLLAEQSRDPGPVVHARNFARG